MHETPWFRRGSGAWRGLLVQSANACAKLPEQTMLLMNLRNVPEEEAEEVRALLDDNGIDYYETHPGLMGFACGAIWAHRGEQVPTAKALLEAYQRDLRERMRAEREARLRDGSAETLTSTFRRQPARVLATLGGVVLLVSLSLFPFVTFLSD